MSFWFMIIRLQKSLSSARTPLYLFMFWSQSAFSARKQWQLGKPDHMPHSKWDYISLEMDSSALNTVQLSLPRDVHLLNYSRGWTTERQGLWNLWFTCWFVASFFYLFIFLCVSINPLFFRSFFQAMGSWCQYPAVTGWEAGDSLDKLQVHHKTHCNSFNHCFAMSPFSTGSCFSTIIGWTLIKKDCFLFQTTSLNQRLQSFCFSFIQEIKDTFHCSVTMWIH